MISSFSDKFIATSLTWRSIKFGELMLLKIRIEEQFSIIIEALNFEIFLFLFICKQIKSIDGFCSFGSFYRFTVIPKYLWVSFLSTFRSQRNIILIIQCEIVASPTFHCVHSQLTGVKPIFIIFFLGHLHSAKRIGVCLQPTLRVKTFGCFLLAARYVTSQVFPGSLEFNLLFGLLGVFFLPQFIEVSMRVRPIILEELCQACLPRV